MVQYCQGLTHIFLGLMFAVANYQIWSDAKKINKQPKIIIDYDLETFNIIYLEIKNIGNDYARNIKTSFNPDIEIEQDNTINSKNFLQNIDQLAPNKKIRFLFGTFFDQKYLQKFNVDITYEDLNKNSYTEKQIIELSSFVGSSAPKKESDDMASELRNISKYLKSQSDNSNKTNEILKNGLLIRNINLQNCSLEETQTLLKNIITKGSQEDLWLKPYVYDFTQVVKIIRDKLMALENLNEEQEDILSQINIIHKYQPMLGKDKDFDMALNALKEKL